MKVQLTTEQKNELRLWMSENPNADEDAVNGIAAYLADMQREPLAEYIRKELADLRQQQEWNRRASEAMWYPFLAPAPNGGKDVVVSESRDLKVVQRPPRQEVRVRVRDLDAFCRAHKLDKQKMVEVGEGRIKSHRGWERSHGIGPLALGTPYQEPKPQVDTSRPVDGHQEIRRITTFVQKPVVWTVEGI